MPAFNNYLFPSKTYTIIKLALYFTLCLKTAFGDFAYDNFQDTTSLYFNGAAKATECELERVDRSMIHPRKNRNKEKSFYRDENGAYVTETVSTFTGNDPNDSDLETIAGFGHRDTISVPNGNNSGTCSSRLRITPSLPSTVGSIWYNERLPILKGFVTTFTFQITGQSKVCTEHRHEISSIEMFTTCTVHGGDGFAFVVHLDKNETEAIGIDGHELGYGGISNSIAIEFDTWTNVNTQGSNDFFHDHIAIHSMSINGNTAGELSALGFARPVELADGKVHQIKIQYLPYVAVKYFHQLTANDNLIPYIKDNGKGRRLGTIAIFIDGGIEKDIPILAIPINLSVLLDLPQSLAYVGFTGSTGKRWETHEIINWSWCDTGDCLGDPNEIERLEVDDDSHLPPLF